MSKSDAGWVRGKSKKWRTQTYRQFYAEIDSALREGGISEELMQELASFENIKAHETIVHREWDTIQPIMYDAYKILRHRGYWRHELIM